MSHGGGDRRVCHECGQPVPSASNHISHRELRGPRQITSSNVDRIFDDRGLRFLIIEEKQQNERLSHGQTQLLKSLAQLPTVDVWGVRGTPDSLTVKQITPDGSTTIATGNFTDYQAAVSSWFGSPLPDPWECELWEAGELPFEAPSWCPPDVWHAFDLALTAVRKARRDRREVA